MKLFYINSGFSVVRALLGWPILIVGAYFAAALLGSMIPVNSSWIEPTNGTTLYLQDNGIHTSIIIPCVSSDGANACLFPKTDLPETGQEPRWQMIGWGDREFYLNTPTWSDLDLGTATTAFIGSGKTLVHVDHLTYLPNTGLKAFNVDDGTFVKILLGIKQATVTDVYADPKLTPINGYGPRDIFYEGSKSQVRSYSALYTCNNWVSDILADAGVKTGYWTPFPFGVMWWHQKWAAKSSASARHQGQPDQ